MACECLLQTLYFYLGSDVRGKANAALYLLAAIARHSTQAARDLAQAFDFTLSALTRLCNLPRQVSRSVFSAVTHAVPSYSCLVSNAYLHSCKWSLVAGRRRGLGQMKQGGGSGDFGGAPMCRRGRAQHCLWSLPWLSCRPLMLSSCVHCSLPGRCPAVHMF